MGQQAKQAVAGNPAQKLPLLALAQGGSPTVAADALG
jgi:hypothetical protein